MLVRDVMIRSLRTVEPSTKLLEVASMMCLYRFSGLPVVGKDNKLLGFVAEKDVLNKLFPSLEDLRDGMAGIEFEGMESQYHDILNLKVEDVMTRGVITASPDSHVLRATSVMVRHKFRRIPVAERGKLVGMLSMGDVHKALFHLTVSNYLET
ncbi:MAG: CBS domain-containing protein [Pseudomonadota bacterium]